MLLLGVLFAASSFAADPNLRVENAWIRAAPPGASMLAGYATLINDSERPVRIETLDSEDFGMVEIHRTVVEDGVSRMRPVDVLEVPARGRVVLEPGGLHLMLMQPKRALAEGDSSEIVLRDESGIEHRAVFAVRLARADVHIHPHPLMIAD